MDIWRAIKSLQNIVEYWQCRPTEREAAQLAISALQEQAEREKGCEYCNSDSLDGLVLTHIFDRPKLAFRGGNLPMDDDEKPVFCPKCGRRLK